LKAVIQLALEAGFKKVEASVQLLSNSRQIGRMLTTGGIDPSFVDNMLIDAIGVSPFFRSRSVEEYSDIKQRGLFNIIAERVRKMIAKNYPKDVAIGKDLFANVRKEVATG
jgi:hypothetical protein